MPLFDYTKEPLRDILFIDAKSFYASCECIARGLHPLKALLVVMSTADNTGNGLVLSSSPMAKKILGISNVTRAEDVPDHPDLIKAHPRMNHYINENIKINKIFNQYVANEDILIYSIDETMLDVTKSLHLFIKDPALSRNQKRRQLARKIQLHVKKETGIYLTVGIGDNPLLAKLSLDNYSKQSASFIDEIRYQDVPKKIWRIHPLTDFWGIGHNMQKNFEKIGILSVKQLAQADPYVLKEKFGVIGLQLFHHSHGIDRTIISEHLSEHKEKSYGNSQVLPYNYVRKNEIETVIKEMAEQVAGRIRRHKQKTACIHLFIGYAYHEKTTGFSRQMKIPATQQTKLLQQYLLHLFNQHYTGQAVRHVGVTFSKLSSDYFLQMNLFEDTLKIQKYETLDHVVDDIRNKYGFTAIIRANSLSNGARSIARSLNYSALNSVQNI